MQIHSNAGTRRAIDIMQIIYLAGIPRCGSSWACRVLTKGTDSVLLDEPFHYIRIPERKQFHLQYLPAGAASPNITRIIKHDIGKHRPWWKPWIRPERFVIKDVQAYLAIERIHETLKAHVVCLMRNPCDAATSWAKLNYNPNNAHEFYAQPRLKDEFLAPFADHAPKNDSFYFQFGALWGASHFVMKKLCARIPGAQFIRYETLCANPEQEFDAMLKGMGLTLLPAGREFIAEHNREKLPNESEYSINRKATDEIDKWKSILTAEESRLVVEGARPFGLLEEHYPDLLTLA